MDNFYILNELQKQNDKKDDDGSGDASAHPTVKQTGKAGYVSDVDIDSAYNIYVKAIEHVIEIIKRSMELLENLNSDDAERTEKLVKFTQDTNNAKNIIKEFQKSLSIIPEDADANVINSLYRLFATANDKINIFFILKQPKYGREILEIMGGILKIFHHLGSVLTSAKS
ncbi:conserved hypothetical protein [Alphaproteobacteria bacterium]